MLKVPKKMIVCWKRLCMSTNVGSQRILIFYMIIFQKLIYDRFAVLLAINILAQVKVVLCTWWREILFGHLSMLRFCNVVKLRGRKVWDVNIFACLARMDAWLSQNIVHGWMATIILCLSTYVLKECMNRKQTMNTFVEKVYDEFILLLNVEVTFE